MSARVYDLTELFEPTTDAERTDDLAGYFYALGRMDQGAEPVASVVSSPPLSPNVTATAWLFGRMWAQIKSEFDDPDSRRNYMPGVAPAWENFVESEGHTLDPSWTREG